MLRSPLLLRSALRTSHGPPSTAFARQWPRSELRRALHGNAPLRRPAPTSPLFLRAVWRPAAKPAAPVSVPAADALVSPDGRISAPRPEGSGQAIPAGVMDQLRGDPELYARFVNAEAPSASKALLVALGLAGSCYVAGAWSSVAQEEEAEAQRKQQGWSRLLKSGPADCPRWTAGAARLQQACDFLHLPQAVREALSDGYVSCFLRYRDLPPYSQDAVPIIALNAGVLFLWTLSRIPAAGGLRRLMNRTFLDVPSSGRRWTMLTSSFSHSGFIHFAMNNFALLSLGSVGFASANWYASSGFRRTEASAVPHLFAFAGAVGSLAALAFHIQGAVNFRMLARRAGYVFAKAKIGTQSGLGASGWIYGAMVLTVMSTPEMRLNILFLPHFQVSGTEGMLGLCMVDALCILFRVQIFAHWVHLTGAALGYAYYYYGLALWEATRAQVQEVRAQLGLSQVASQKGACRAIVPARQTAPAAAPRGERLV